MPLKQTATTQRKPSLFSAVSYRIPLPVTQLLLFADKSSYPICPRCDITIEWEYMRFCNHCGQRLSWNLFEFAKVNYAPRKHK